MARNQLDFSAIQARLVQTIDECLQDHCLTDQQRQLLLNATERILQQLHQAAQNRPAMLQPTRTQMTPSYLLHSPVYRPLSPAPADTEIQDLEDQVELAAQRAAVMRQTAPYKLKDIYARKLAQLRPKLDAAGAEIDKGADEGIDMGQQNSAQDRDAPLTYSPDPVHLKEKLTDAGSKLPILRARLEEASDRVQRVFAVLSTELNRPPPNTVERALLGKTLGCPELAGTEACKQALESGIMSAQRRLGRDVQPVPLALPEKSVQ